MGSELDTRAIPSTWKVVQPYGTHPSDGSRDIPTFVPNRFNRNLWSLWGNKMPILCRMGSKRDTCTVPSTRKVVKPRGAHPGRGSRDIHAFGPESVPLQFNESLGNRMPVLVRMGSKLDTCATPSTWKLERPCGAHPSHGSRDIPASGPNRFHCSLMSHWGIKMPILVRMGSKLGSCTIPSTWKVVKPYGTHPGRGPRDIRAFGPNRFRCNLTSRRGSECRSLAGWARNSVPALSQVRGSRWSHMEPTRATDPEISKPSARIGLIVI